MDNFNKSELRVLREVSEKLPPVLPETLFEPCVYKEIKDERFEGIYDYTDELIDEFIYLSGVYIAGGCLRNLLGGDDIVADIDIFFRDSESLKKTIDLMSWYDETWYEAFRCPAGELITYKTVIDRAKEDITKEDYKNQRKIQFITRNFYSSPKELINSFDFVPTCACLYENILYTHPNWVKSVRKKVLNTHFMSYPVASIFRMMKYKDKGYIVPSESVIEMVTQINEAELDEGRLALYID